MLIDNRKLLKENHPTIYQYFSNKDKANYKLTKLVDSKENVPSLTYKVNNKEMLIHSKYAPVKEGFRIYNKYADNLDDYDHIIFYGVGLGYHINEFINKQPYKKYSIYEPSEEIFSRFINNFNVANIGKQNLNHLFVDNKEMTDINFKSYFLNTNDRILIVPLPSYERIFKVEYKQFNEEMKDVVRSRRTQLHTNYRYQKRWVINSLKNFKYVIDTPNFLQEPKKSPIKDKPVVIVSAGPSLDEDIEHIRYIKENKMAYIFSVGSAINTLIDNNIKPHAMFTYDPQERNQIVFQKVINKDIRGIPMIFGSSVGYETLEKYEGPKMHFITSQDVTSKFLLEGQLKEHQIIMDSPSIAVMTLQIVQKLKAGLIILAGQNLSFRNGKRHASGVDYSRGVDKNLIEISDVSGNQIETNYGYNKMKQALEYYIKSTPKIKVINTTKFGASISGTEFVEVEQVIDKYLSRNIVDNINELVMYDYSIKQPKQRINDLIEDQNNLSKLIKNLILTLEHLEYNANRKYTSRIEKNFNEIDKVFSEINENNLFKYFIISIIRVEVDIINKDIKQFINEKNIIKKAKEVYTKMNRFIKKVQKENNEILKYIKELQSGT